MYYGMLVEPYRASINCTACTEEPVLTSLQRRQELLSSACTCMRTECIAALYANQTSQYAMLLAALKTWEVFPVNGSYALASHLARHTQDPIELSRKYDEDYVLNSRKEERETLTLVG